MRCILLLFLTLSSIGAMAKDFTEVYESAGGWRVDHFRVSPGKLQDFVGYQTFQSRAEADSYAKSLKTISKSMDSFALTVTETKSHIWSVENEWSEAWEEKYAAWVEKNFDKNFFVKYSLATDCADVAYTLRWIFSRMNGLPATATLAGSGLEVSHESMKEEWGKLPTHSDWDKDQRFLAALDWLLNNVFTGTLAKDGYPVEINSQTIRPGLVNLIGGHTEVFSVVSTEPETVPFVVLSSTVPRSVRVLSERVFLDSSPFYDPASGGLLRFRWPIKAGARWESIPKEKMPFYSLEQYSKDLCESGSGFSQCIMERLGIVFNADLVFRKLLSNMEDFLQQRKAIVEEGYLACQSIDCSPGSVGYEDHSTPSRDKRLLGQIRSMQTLANQIGKSNEFYQWRKDASISIAGKVLSVNDFFDYLENGFVSYDPRDEIGARWSLDERFITATVEKKISIFEVERKGMLENAEPCRKNPRTCEAMKSSYRDLSTADLDYKERVMVHSWKELCRQSTRVCPVSDLLSDLHGRIWFRSPVPWHSLKEREGERTQARTGHILHASHVEKISDQFLMLDFYRIYDVKKRSEIPMPEGLILRTFNASSGTLVEHDGNSVLFRNLDLEISGSIALEIDSKVGACAIPVGKDHLFISSPCSFIPAQKKTGWILDVKNRSISEKILFEREIISDPNDPSFLILQGEEIKLLIAEEDGVVIRKLNSVVGDVTTAKRGIENSVFLTHSFGMQSELLWFKGEEKKTLVSSMNQMRIYPVNDFYFRVDDWGGEDFTYHLIGTNGEFFLSSSSIISHKLSKDESIVFVKSGIAYQVYQANGPALSKQSLQLKIEDEDADYLEVFSSSERWVNFYDEDRLKMFDLDGNILYSSKDVLKYACNYTWYLSRCQGDERILGEYYILNSVENVSLGVTGFADGLDIKEIITYDLTKTQEDNEFSSAPSRGLAKGDNLPGFLINLAPNLVYYLPEEKDD